MKDDPLLADSVEHNLCPHGEGGILILTRGPQRQVRLTCTSDEAHSRAAYQGEIRRLEVREARENEGPVVRPWESREGVGW